VDVIHAGQALSATRFTGGHQCESLRKSVEFQIPARGTMVIQISGSTDQVVQVLFTAPPSSRAGDPRPPPAFPASGLAGRKRLSRPGTP
jgi:hypothetical protein